MEEIKLNQIDYTKWSERSESITELAKALCKAQAEIESVKKESSNPFFKSKYADLSSVWAAIREPLTKNGLCLVQNPSSKDNRAQVATILMHTSGEYIRSVLEMAAVKSDPQGIGSAITYARRYAILAIIGIAPEDDDGNAASHGGGNDKKKPMHNLKTADQIQNETAKKVFKNDDLSWDSNGNVDMSTTQKINKAGIYHYNLASYFEGKDVKVINALLRKIEKIGGFELSNNLFAIPKFVDELAPYIVEDVVEGEVAA